MHMLKITEEYLQFAWKFNLYEKNKLCWNNETIEISYPGEQNHSSGPDFFNARVKIGDTIWAGNVEIHLKASDWYRHQHEKDPEYDSVILHVVLEADCDIFRLNGERIPVLEIKPGPEYLEQYYHLVLNKSHIHCSQSLSLFNHLLFKDLITKMTISRLMDKTERVFTVLGKNHYDWEETLYRFLGNSFGLNINKIPFTLLVETVPLKILLKYRNNPETINAILFGQAGFLEDVISGDKYYDTLRKEYMSLRKMLPPRVLFNYSWKFMRLRPANFPTIRISQFASLVIKGFPLFTNITECSEIHFTEKLFSLNTNKYWEDHKLFGRTDKSSIYQMGKDTARLIIINAVIPVLFSYGKFRMRNDLQDRSLRFLEELPPEKNEIMNKWKKAGIYPESAFESQGLLQLYNNYCKPRKCLECIVGCKMVTAGRKEEKITG